MNKYLRVFVCFICVATMSMVASAKNDMFPNKVKTHIGELAFDHGIPSKETSEKLYYELDYHRAVHSSQ